MGKKISIYKKRIPSFLIYTAMVAWLFSACVTPSTSTDTSGKDEVKVPLIEETRVNRPSSSETVVEVVLTEPAPYTAFKLADPPRVILDIRGIPGTALSAKTDVNDGILGDILFEKGKTQAMTTRMTIGLTRDSDYLAAGDDNIIRLTFTQKHEITRPPEKKTADTVSAQSREFAPSEPRILLKPAKSRMNQIVGIDFTNLEHGKSRLTVTTDKKVRYDLDRKGERTLILKLYDSKIPSLLLREIDTRHFETALDIVKPAFSREKKEVSIYLSLREMVPFHVKQTDDGLRMDFGPTSMRPPDKKIVPLNLAEIQTKDLAARQPSPAVVVPVGGQKKGFTGEPMYLDFVNADVTHILRLINEVSKENIIWDPAIAGRKVSMILKNVPWDEALELILKNNNLDKRYVGKNIVWITTKAKMKQILAEEEAAERRLKKEIEDEAKKAEEEQQKAKADEPLVTEFLPVDFAKADEIKSHISLTPRGTMSIDTRTNTIIIKDIAESIEEAKKTVKQFDTPVKQIMIEARIVDASDTFTRDLGLKWNNATSAWRKNVATTTVPPDANDFTAPGERAWGGAFSTNSPANWTNNIGLSFARLTSSGLGAITLDASLALAETEGTAKVMSAPKVIAREGTAATISSGDSIIIPATENVASTTLDATLSLTVTPSAVSYNNFITLDVAVTDDQAPSTSRLLRKSINTTLMIKSGETVVIGGIIKESEGNDVSGVPFLRDIPGLGWLFKAKRKTHSKSELLIFLTPTVLPSPAKML